MAERRGFQEGDQFSYRSVTQGHLVTWTRNDSGVWTADDGRDMPAYDRDVAFQFGQSEIVVVDATGHAVERDFIPGDKDGDR